MPYMRIPYQIQSQDAIFTMNFLSVILPIYVYMLVVEKERRVLILMKIVCHAHSYSQRHQVALAELY
jgi:hypothetical protein